LVAKAFALSNDTHKVFEEEKKKTDFPKSDMTVPGWGSWGTEDTKPQPKKKKKKKKKSKANKLPTQK